MFESLGDRLTTVFDKMTGRGVLSPADIDEALREVRLALLDADVALPAVKDFVAKARELATGEDVLRAVKPSEQVVKIVHDGLVDMLGGRQPVGLNLNAAPPVVVMMAGLQGSGKTTTSGKLAARLRNYDRKRVLMASLDTRRPAAMEQLATLGKQVEVEVLPIMVGQSAPDITRRAMNAARLGGFDVLILDTAGRTTLDEQMMGEAAEIARIAAPQEILLVADALTGQDAVRTAKAFHDRLPLTGMVLTRTDGRRQGRRGAQHAPRHRAADQVPRCRREARRAGGVRRRAGGWPYPGLRRHRGPGGEGRRRLRPSQDREDGPAAVQGPVRPGRPR